MKVPQEDFNLTIGPYQFEVIWSDDVTAAGGVQAQIHGNTQKIFLQKKGKKDQNSKANLIHEMLHAIYYMSGLRGDEDSEKLNITEERLIIRLTPWILMVINQNPHIFSND